jgi:MFS family permease
LWAFIPGIAAIIVTFLIKEKRKETRTEKHYPSFKAFYQYWIQAPTAYKRLAGALLVFTLFNSSDVLLLLRMKETGISDTALIGVYIFYNAVYAILAYPFGVLADKTSLKKILLAGLFLFAVVYAGMCVKGSVVWYLFLFLLYGAYAAATEGISKAWITKLVEKNRVGTAIGTYTGFQSVAALLASSIAGILWFYFGATAAFLSSAIITLLVVIYLYFKTKTEHVISS